MIKFLVYLATVFAGVSAAAKSSCMESLLEKRTSERQQALLTRYKEYFRGLPHPVQASFANSLSYYPENLPILLDLSRGVLDDDGKVVKKPLQISELKALVSYIFPKTRTALLVELYESRLVERDPILLYETLAELAERAAGGALTADESRMIYGKTIN